MHSDCVMRKALVACSELQTTGAAAGEATTATVAEAEAPSHAAMPLL